MTTMGLPKCLQLYGRLNYMNIQTFSQISKTNIKNPIARENTSSSLTQKAALNRQTCTMEGQEDNAISKTTEDINQAGPLALLLLSKILVFFLHSCLNLI